MCMSKREREKGREMGLWESLLCVWFPSAACHPDRGLDCLLAKQGLRST